MFSFLSWSAIIAARVAAIIILPPSTTRSDSVMNEVPVSSMGFESTIDVVYYSLVARASLNTDTAGSTMPSSTTGSVSTTLTSSAAGTTNTKLDDPDDSTTHSSVPMVAGSLAGFIAILAAILVVIVVRRRKQQPISREGNAGPTPRPPLTGRNYNASFESDPFSHTQPRTTAGLENPFLIPLEAESVTKKPGRSRYDYVTDDVELTQRDGAGTKYLPHIAVNAGGKDQGVQFLRNPEDRRKTEGLQSQLRPSNHSHKLKNVDEVSSPTPSSPTRSALGTVMHMPPEKSTSISADSTSLSTVDLTGHAAFESNRMAMVAPSPRDIPRPPNTHSTSRTRSSSNDSPPAYDDMR